MNINIIALYLRQDDPKKNTVLKLAKKGIIKIVRDLRHVPRGLLILNPFEDKIVTPQDHDIVVNRGILVVDCSWSKSTITFKRIGRFLKGHHRRLPFLVSANPSHYGKPYMLTSAEALAATLYIVGLKDYAFEIMKNFKWGLEFLRINYERLENYSRGYLDYEKNYFEFSHDNVIKLLKDYHDLD